MGKRGIPKGQSQTPENSKLIYCCHFPARRHLQHPKRLHHYGLLHPWDLTQYDAWGNASKVSGEKQDRLCQLLRARCRPSSTGMRVEPRMQVHLVSISTWRGQAFLCLCASLGAEASHVGFLWWLCNHFKCDACFNQFYRSNHGLGCPHCAFWFKTSQY